MRERGQVVLVVMLVSAVVLSLGLSVSKRTVTETKIDSDEVLLKEAFSAAESGVDYYLGTGEKTFSSTGVKANVEVAELGGTMVDSGGFVVERKSAFFWLVARNDDRSLDYGNYFSGGSIKVCKENGSLASGSLKIDFYYRSGASFKVKRWMHNFGTGAVSVDGVNVLTETNCANGRQGVIVDFGLSGEIPLLLAVTPIGGGSRIYADGGTFGLPIQGEEISATGKAGEVGGGGEVTRKIRVINRYDELPLFMLEAVTANGSVLSK